ncbi:DUF5063 domain-containing protein [Kribbia dieselivorans]|uniref:DUF5063 domain-containing protein n=1 Tax=Kribbia dieselivorans TaxID=331526 RepID=UPI00083991AE|nr:DUF5063 domain-containing protein [Kribbia dieselivorans]
MTEQPEVPVVAVPDDLRLLADECAGEAQLYLDTVTDVASGNTPDVAISLSLLALSQVLAMGARLGAMQDFVPQERFEPDSGPEPEVDPLRNGLANVLEGLDEYADLVDPVTSTEVTTGLLSVDLSSVAAALSHGLAHHRAGRVTEALWWWQFSYLSDWGDRAAMALRVLQGLLAHIRLDADDEMVSEAQFDALHP